MNEELAKKLLSSVDKYPRNVRMPTILYSRVRKLTTKGGRRRHARRGVYVLESSSVVDGMGDPTAANPSA